MNRQSATKVLRDTLDKNGLTTWKIRLNTNINTQYYGLCSYKDKTIILNAFHVDSHPEPEVLNTIRHEVAHALNPKQGHNNIWSNTARLLGCDNTLPCASYSLSEEAIDAIRSGASLEITFEEQIIRTPKYAIHQHQDKCETCGKVAKVFQRLELTDRVILKYECGHFKWYSINPTKDYGSIVFDIPFDNPCKDNHKWGRDKYRTTCMKCGAHKLYDYQVEGARSIERNKGNFAIFDDMGLGKTLQPLAYIKLNAFEACPYLWVTKAKVKYQHVREIVRVLGPDYFPFIINSSKGHIPSGVKGFLMSYDLFRRMDKDTFDQLKIKTLILDECQAIKNPDSARTQSIRDIAKAIPAIIPLSGTPWKNKGSEFFVVLNMLDPKMFWSFKAFKDKYIRYVTDPMTGKEIEGGIKDADAFREQIKHIAIRRERKDVMKEIPEVNRIKLYCELPEAARDAYQEEENNLINIVKDAAIDGTEGTFKVSTQMNDSIMKMRQIIGIAKVPAIVDHLQNFLDESDRKIICFVHHIKVGELIKQEMDKYFIEEGKGNFLVQLLGGTSAEATKQLQDTFNDNPKCKLFVGSSLASGEGLNLQKSCSDAIISERQWNPANEEQMEGRIQRIGQEKDIINVVYALAEKSVDTILDHKVEFKRMEFHSSMNQQLITPWNTNSLFKAIIDVIMKGRVKAA